MKKSRFTIIYICFIICFSVIAARLVFLQGGCSSSARKTVATRLSLTEVSKAPRGNLSDRNNMLLAGSREGYIVKIIKGTDEDLSLTIKHIAALTRTDESALLARIEAEGFSAFTPFVVTNDADLKTVTEIFERPEDFPCAQVSAMPVRDYLYPESAVHILGRCGIISAEEYRILSGYSMNDFLGKQGVEKAAEKFLRGKDGASARSFSGKTYEESTPPIPGEDITLTIDINLQMAAEKALSDTIKSTREASAGATVIKDVNSGEILAICSYPAYNINDFSKNYTQLLKDKNKPLFNRALSGLYEPGSTFKPITALAAMGSNNLAPGEKILTRGSYRYYDREFRCNIFREKGKTHGKIDVIEALGVSCNYFFYELAHRMGIKQIAETAALFGLGAPTGIELSSEEATGHIASFDSRDTTWYAGDTLQAAIGQSDNRFTPVALANYASAIANGGTLYSCNIFKSIGTKNTTPKILNKIAIPKEHLQKVVEGMVFVTKQGTAKDIFSDFDITVAGKTGSAQRAGKTNGLFLGFAPAENPQIAFCTVIEGAPSGNVAADSMKQVLKTYFR